MAAGGSAVAPPGGVWKTLAERVAFINYVPPPAPAALVEEREFVNRAGETYHVLKHRELRTYLSLPPDAYALWRMMDGTKPIRKIAVEYALAHQRIVTGLLRGLVDELRAKGFLTDRPARVFTRLVERRQRRTPGYWLLALFGALISHPLVRFRRGDAALGAHYRAFGWLFFTRPAAVAMWVILVAGFAAWLVEVARGSYSLVKTEDSYVLGFATLLLLDALATSLHELGHALAVKHKGREVIAVGVLLYYGAPCAYVNTSDIWMADRRARLLVSWSGPFVTLTLAGLMGLVALAGPGGLVGELAFKAATVWFLDGLFNFIPLLELDGYYLLVDWLERPLLRARSFHFLRRELWPKLRSRAPWTPEERVLGAFGALAVAFSILMLGLTLWVWNLRGASIADELWNLPAWYGRPLLALFLLIFAGPLVAGLGLFLARGLRWLYGQIAWRLNERRLTQRAQPLLDSHPYLQHFSPAERAALGQHLLARRASTGQVLVRQGDPPDGFYFIRHGEAEVERLGPDGQPRRLATLGPGDHFGELAYLTGAPRNATVRARTPLELYYLDGGHFRRWLEADLQGRAEVTRRLLDHALLDQLPLFSALAPTERDHLFAHIGVERFPLGAFVFRQAEPGASLYVVAEGRLEVLVRGEGDPLDEPGRSVAELGAGEYFGEIALLNDEPRSASVRAIEPAVCYTLTRAGFEQLLEGAPSSRASLDRLALERLRAARAGLGTLVDDGRSR